MSDRKDAAYRRIERNARTAWHGVSPHLPPRVADAIKRPAQAALGSRNGRAGTYHHQATRPHLARVHGGTVYLVEGFRKRAVEAPLARTTLKRTLGPPAEVGEDQLGALTPGSAHFVAVDDPDLGGLIAQTPEFATIAVAGVGPRAVDGRGRVLRPLWVGAPGGRGADPYRGIGALDLLALARTRGATYFLLPKRRDGWLRSFHDLADHLARRATLVATSPAGTLWLLPTSPPRGDPKVFGIGLNKTGTTTLHLACTELGLRSYHWGDRSAYHAVLEAQRDGERLLHHASEQYDVYCDIETLSVRFDLADLQYPGSRFVLTVRDVDAWVDSRKRHAERNARNIERGTYQGTNTRIDEELWRAQWDAHIERVTKYFGDRKDLLVFDITAGDGWEKLAPFLGRPVPATPFPKGNVDTRQNRPAKPKAKAAPKPPGTPTPKPKNKAKAEPKPPPRSKLERAAARAWRTTRKVLPDSVAEAIRKPSKRVLRKLGLIRR